MTKRMKLLSLILAGSIVASSGITYVEAAQQKEINGPVAGIAGAFLELPFTLADSVTEPNAVTPVAIDAAASGAVTAALEPEAAAVSENEIPVVESEFAQVAIAQVMNYVNVRQEPNTESEVLGKLYNNSAATVLETTENGWYLIQSGNVIGFVKSEYVVVGDEELARAVSTRYAKVNTTTLFVRSEPTTEAKVLTMLPEGDDLEVLDESETGWVLVSTVEGEGYISEDYVTLSTEYVEAESKEEEEARLAKEEAERKAAAEAAEEARRARAEAERKAANKAAQSQNSSNTQNSATTQQSGSSQSGSSQSNSSQSGNSQDSSSSENKAPVTNTSNGQAVVDYARQFLGNPYVYGGTSLTNGTDCSGFVMGVYAAFGVSLPRNSAAQRGAGYAVNLADIQPGDIVCYSGHVGIYAGNNTLIHASNERTGITLTSPVTYRKVLAVRRIF